MKSGVNRPCFERVGKMARNNGSYDLKIRISGLSNGLHDYQFSPEPSSIGLGQNFRVPVEVDAHLDKAPRQILLRAEIRTAGTFACDRCLESFEQPIAARLNLFYIFDELDAGKLPPDEVKVISPDTVTIDLTEDVREMVMLSVPLKLLCREDCKGLCPQCGADWNVSACDCQQQVSDPRWSGLQDLLNK